MKKIIRVFPRRTKLTPDDENVRIGVPPDMFDEADEVHISVTWTDDLPKAERLAKAWEKVAPVRIGGPATGERGDEFVSGMYLKKGAVITSRGCPNRCWFCSVWKREGNEVRELDIKQGYNVLDDNLLRCTDKHVDAVFDMLRLQKQPAELTGGLEAASLKSRHIDLLTTIRVKKMFFAFDTPDDEEPLRIAGIKLHGAGFIRNQMGCYCLIGFRCDTFEKEKIRLKKCVDYGFYPMAMLYRDGKSEPHKEWKIFQRQWARPAIIYRRYIKL